MSKVKKLDPILLSVISTRFDTICSEMARTMLRTARSAVFFAAHDFLTAIYDGRTRLVAQQDYVPALAASIPPAMRAIVNQWEGKIYEGDIFVLGDPWLAGNNHSPDWVFAKPVFCKGELVFWTVTKGHQVEIGGAGAMGFNPMATDTWMEGFRLPIVKLWERGEYQKQIWDIILANSRLPSILEGDMHCQVGACRIGERALLTLCDKYGTEFLNRVADELIANSENEVRDKIRAMPNGTWYAEEIIARDGISDRMFTARLKMTVNDESITLDWSNSDPQSEGCINSTLTNTLSTSFLGIAAVLGISRIREGTRRPIEVIAPEGLIVNSRPGAANVPCTTVFIEVILNCIWKALAEVVPDLTYAGWCRISSTFSLHFDPRKNNMTTSIQFNGKGGGAATDGVDGWDCTGSGSLGALSFTDPEIEEVTTPVRVISCGHLVKDSAGAGQWRGGYGSKYARQILSPRSTVAYIGSGNIPVTAPPGILGGKPGGLACLSIIKPDGREIPQKINTFLPVEYGDIIVSVPYGGGGFGNPFLRPVAKIVEEVLDDILSIEKARNDYGVVIDPTTLEVNWKETNKLRSKSGKNV